MDPLCLVISVMTPSDQEAESAEPQRGVFATTHWSVVMSAGQSESPQAAQALERLCRTYWYPLYAYVRRRGHGPDDAKDLTQEFFARLLEKKSLARADRAKGRFRSFLLGALNHFLADEKDRAEAKKRGGGQTLISWDQDDAEERIGAEPMDELSPERIFERRWALSVLEQATKRLRNEYHATGQAQLFEHLKSYIEGGTDTPSYAETAIQLDLSESAVKSAIFRFRRRYHELVRAEVGQTVADANELDEELRQLRAVFGESGATF